MTKVRTGKVKGSAFEYSCQYSLRNYTAYPVIRTSERGFQMQYDLRIELESGKYIAFECKRLAGFSWNELIKYFKKLEKVTKDNCFNRFLLFKGNNQPCLVMWKQDESYNVCTFEDYFGVPFEKHKSTRVKK